MPGLLSKRSALPDIAPALTALNASDIDVRRAKVWDKHIVADWARRGLRALGRNP